MPRLSNSRSRSSPVGAALQRVPRDGFERVRVRSGEFTSPSSPLRSEVGPSVNTESQRARGDRLLLALSFDGADSVSKAPLGASQVSPVRKGWVTVANKKSRAPEVRHTLPAFANSFFTAGNATPATQSPEQNAMSVQRKQNLFSLLAAGEP
jgi:hypothetical protein